MKIRSYVWIVLLAFVAVSCADRIFSKDKDSPFDPRTVQERLNPTWEEARTQKIEKNLKILEYRVRELGWIQSGVFEYSGSQDWETFTMDQSYQDTDYAIMITPRSHFGTFGASPVSGNQFKVIINSASPLTFSWLTIGQ